jgi:hypothetical protein
MDRMTIAAVWVASGVTGGLGIFMLWAAWMSVPGALTAGLFHLAIASGIAVVLGKIE